MFSSDVRKWVSVLTFLGHFLRHFKIYYVQNEGFYEHSGLQIY